MQERADTYLAQLNKSKKIHSNIVQMITILSLLVVLTVFWGLKLTGITLAGEAFCGQEEHVHSEECLEQSLTCTTEEADGHIHSESCIRQDLICGVEEALPHIHSLDCLEKGLSCTLEETEGHTHDDSCYAVIEGSYVCGLEETEGHAHTQECWDRGIGFGCGLTEAQGHTHTAECLTEQMEFSCGLEVTEGHTHQDDCFVTSYVCLLEEHIHVESCYSDIYADLESSDDWEMTLAELPKGASTAENVVTIARSQLGYTESALNFEVGEDGIRRGITRYGQWYGNPYGDWASMFVSFCLYYAGAEALPVNAGPEAMRVEWEQAGLYLAADEFAPQPGNLIFLQKETVGEVSAGDAVSENSVVNAVAIITEFDGENITAIEGDLNNTVAETTYSVEDPAVIGYGQVPNLSGLTLLAATLPTGAEIIAQTTAYDESMFTATSCFVVYTVNGENYYAFDGTGNAVQIYIDESGNILSDVADPDTLLWTFTGSNGSYLIKNLSSGRYMHAYPNNGSGVTTGGAYNSTLINSGSGVKIRSNSEYARLDATAGRFIMTQDERVAAVYQFGMISRCTVWLDGTNGGLGHLSGSKDQDYTMKIGDVFQLPDEWQSPAQYANSLKGWYDVTNSVYYAPGAEVTVTGNMVFYADWAASTYDIGQYNASVANTVSTQDFITTYVFDYNYLFNALSANAQVTASAADHSEVWSIATSGNVAYQDQESLNFVFIDYDSDGSLDKPNNRQTHNTYPGAGIVTDGIYNTQRAQALFEPENALGKNYLGAGDHLFQIMTDPDDEYYGYYYYDSQRNAASYNQSQGRFYVYEYLEATSAAIGSSYSGFLPLNSPYANTNGNNTASYSYAGVNGEYAGVNHIQYASGYANTDQVLANFAFGMKMDVRFYLPDNPGEGGNTDIYGNEMHFHFSGDDDVWVLVDGQLVLDIGGIHGIESGDINFSTGVVSVNGSTTGDLSDYGIQAGEHVMTVMYLERGASQSNCAIYFNLAPRYSLDIRKEDVLTQQLLDGAAFSVYTDAGCSVPAELYTSEAAYKQGEAATNTFIVSNGFAHMWGLSPGKTYYIRETAPPSADGYSLSQGTIQITIDKEGVATYHVEILENPSPGFTVHGVRIDEQTRQVYIVVTNAPDSVTDTTTVQVYKKWEDTADHSSDYITAYLKVTEPDGTVRRIREILLSDENGWKYTWTNLPKYDYNTLKEVQYGIEESYESGYYSTVRKITELTIETSIWAEAYSFADGESYLLKTSSGCLATTSASDAAFIWMDQEKAKLSPLALWTADIGSDGKVKFTNGAGQILTFNYSSSSSNRYFYATTASSNYQTFTAVDTGAGFRLYATRSNRAYYLYSLNTSTGRISSTTTSSRGMVFTPMKKIVASDVQEIEDWAYQITNTPLDANNETSLTVQKNWDIGTASLSSVNYQEAQVTVKLLANGVETGRTVTLNLKNGWVDTFLGLPYKDVDGNVISYSVLESWDTDEWSVNYGAVVASGADPPTYSTTITNTYRWGGGPELPSTGSAERILCMLCGWVVILSSLVYGFGSRHKRERRMK